MEVSPNVLRRDTVRLITTIDAQIDEVAKYAEEHGVSSIEYRDANGNWPLIQLLAAKATAYNTLVLLQTPKK